MVTPYVDDGEQNPAFSAVIRSLSGRPARVSLNTEHDSGESLVVPGTLIDVADQALEFEAVLSLWGGYAGNTLTLEVVLPEALIQCLTSVVARHLPHRLVLGWPERVVVIQRRSHPRKNVHLSIKITLVPEKKTYRGQTVNLSVGGVAFRTEAALSTGMKLHVCLAETGELRHKELGAEVVRCQPLPDGTWQYAARWRPGLDAETANLVSTILRGTSARTCR